MSIPNWRSHKDHDIQMQKVQRWASHQFEHYLCDWFKGVGELEDYQPVLPNGRQPDFLLRDSDGNACYADAKVYYGPREPHSYYQSLLINWLGAQKAIGDLQVDLQYVGGAMTAMPTGNELRSVTDWLVGIDWDYIHLDPRSPRGYLLGDQVAATDFNFNGVIYRATPIRILDEPSAYGLVGSVDFSTTGTVQPDRESWLGKRIRRAAETYHPDQLGGLPLVIIALNFSTEFGDDDIYGSAYIRIDTATGESTQSGYTGMGLWRNSTGRKEVLAHVPAIWWWERRAADRPILYTDPDVENPSLPLSLSSYQKWMWTGAADGQIQLELVDSGKSRDSQIESLWQEYVERSRGVWAKSRA